MTKKPLQIDITCIYCGINKATWKCDLCAHEIEIFMTVPLCNACSLLPETILIGQIMSQKNQAILTKSRSKT